jgi:Ca-activated chloride channel family protein
MKLRSVALWAAFGIVASTAGALAIPIPGGPSGKTPATKTESVDTASDVARFTAGQTLAIDARLAHTSVAKNTAGETYLYASIVGGESAASAPPVNLAIVIDRSGSMKGDRIANAILAATGIIDRMRDGDSVTVVSFDTQAQVVVPPTRATTSSRPSIQAAIRSLRLGGDTCISCGIEEAMAQLNLTTLGTERINRMILLSDGATNHGITDPVALRAMASRMRDRGCSISTIGVDVDFDEKVLALLAGESNGHHYFVQNAADLPRVFADEFDGLLASVASDTELSIGFEPGVFVDQVFDRSFRREGDSRVVVPFGTFGAKQEKTLLVKLRVPADRAGVQPVAQMTLAYRDLTTQKAATSTGALALKIVDGAGSDIDPFVEARLERSRTAQSLTEANALFAQGRVEEAKNKLALQQQEIANVEKQAKTVAPHVSRRAPARSSIALDEDFTTQRDAIARADKGFAIPPPNASPAAGAPIAAGKSPPPAPKPAETREGKAVQKKNQIDADRFAF